MAPSDLNWHRLYAETMNRIWRELFELQNHPSTEDAEDLGDYVDALATLVTFRPTTRVDLEREARDKVYGGG